MRRPATYAIAPVRYPPANTFPTIFLYPETAMPPTAQTRSTDARTARRFTPRVSALEDRTTPATFFVDPTLAGQPAGSAQTFNAGFPNQRTVTVGSDGFATFNAALAAAAGVSGLDTIQLSSGVIPVDNSGGTVSVQANNPVTVVGSGTSGAAASVLQPTTNTSGGFVSVLQADGTGAVLNLSGLVFDGLAGTRNVGRAVTYTDGATGTIDGVIVANVAFPSVDGYAITARTGSSIVVRNSTIQNYGRAGVTVSDSTATIQNNTIIGQGSANRLNYGVQVANLDATSTVIVNANTITNNLGGSFDSNGDFTTSASVFTFTQTDASPVVQIYGNNITNGSAGVLVDSTNDTGVNSNTVQVYANNFTNNAQPAIIAQTSTAGAVPAPNNYYSGTAPSANNPNGISSNVATGGTFLAAPAPVVVAASPAAYSQQAGVPLPQVITTSTFAVGAGSGTPSATVYGADGSSLATLTPTLDPLFTGGVRVARADVNGDGAVDTIIATGPGTADLVQVISGTDNTTVLASFTPFADGFTGGLFVAAADLNADGKAEVVVSADLTGGPRVTVYDGASLVPTGTPLVLANFFGIADVFGNIDANFRGGARVGLADVNGDGTPDLLVAAGFSGGPRVTIWDGNGVAAGNGGAPTILPLANFFAFEDTLRNGTYVSGTDINGDGKADVVLGAGPGGGPRVRVADAAKVLALGTFSLDAPAAAGATLSSFFAGSSDLRGGVRVLGRDLNGDGIGDIITGGGLDSVSDVRIYPGTSIQASPNAPTIQKDINPFGATLADGVYVG